MTGDVENGSGGDTMSGNLENNTMKYVTGGRLVDLLLFARIVCILNFGMFAVSLASLITYETGLKGEDYKFRNPLTHTAMIWTPHTDELTPPNPLFEQATCKSYISSDFYKPDQFVQEAIFLYSTVHSRWLITGAIFLGVLVQAATVIDKESYYLPIGVGNTHATGFLERSISMPLFVVVLLLQTGMHDMWTILSLMFNAWSSMLFSFFAEILFQGDGGFLTINTNPFVPKAFANTVRFGGGFLLWSDGNVHYHALAMLIAVTNYVLVSGSLVYNMLLINSCMASQPKTPAMVALPIYATVALYGLLLGAQAFTAYVKDKPSTVEKEKAELIKAFKSIQSVQKPTTQQIKDHQQALERGDKTRTDYALHLEFIYGLLDLLIKSIMTLSFFLFNRN